MSGRPSAIDVCETPLAAPAMPDGEAAALADVFKALGDPIRVKILHRLASVAPEGVCVCDLLRPLGLAQPSVSYHLRILREVGLVTRTQRGTFAFYAVQPGALGHVASLLSAEPARAA